MNLSKVGTKEKWAGNKKIAEGVRGNPKKLSNRPTRGLVFGPTKGEISLSESGKRLRVEKVDAGRAGGVFREKVEGIGFTSRPLQLRDEALENPMESNISEMEQRQITTLSNSQRRMELDSRMTRFPGNSIGPNHYSNHKLYIMELSGGK